MSSTLRDLTIVGVGEQSQPASSARHLVRLGEVLAMNSGVAPKGHTHLLAEITDFQAKLPEKLLDMVVDTQSVEWLPLYSSVTISGLESGSLNAAIPWAGTAYADNELLVLIAWRNGAWDFIIDGTHSYRSATSDIFGAWTVVDPDEGGATPPTITQAGATVVSVQLAVRLQTGGGILVGEDGLFLDSGVLPQPIEPELPTISVADSRSLHLTATVAEDGDVLISGTVRRKLGGGIQEDASGLYIDSGVVRGMIPDPAATHDPATVEDTTSLHLTIDGHQKISGAVRRKTGGGIDVGVDGLFLNSGVVADIARSVTPAGHDAVTLAASDTIDAALAGQRLSLEVRRVAGGGIDATASGLTLNSGVVRRIVEDLVGGVAGVLSTSTVDLHEEDGILSADVRIDADPPTGDYPLGVNGDGLFLPGSGISPRDHTHAIATEESDGFMSADQCTKLNSLFLNSGVQSLAFGAIKLPCLVATTGNITLVGFQTIDGVTLELSQRVLVWKQASERLNGIYDVAAGAWVRSEDSNASGKFLPGFVVGIAAGTTQKASMFMFTNTDVIELDVTPLEFTQIAAGGGGGGGGNKVYSGSGSPEAVQTGNPGDVYNQIDAGVYVAQWIKASGAGNTGWS